MGNIKIKMEEILIAYKRPLYYLKVLIQYTLIGMIFYQSHLGLRDSDKLTFENRVRETINFLEANHPGYRMYMIEQLGIDRVNCTRKVIPNLQDMAPMYVLAHSQWGVLAACILLLNSRLGCILTFTHAFFAAVGSNMHQLKPLFFKYVKW